MTAHAAGGTHSVRMLLPHWRPRPGYVGRHRRPERRIALMPPAAVPASVPAAWYRPDPEYAEVSPEPPPAPARMWLRTLAAYVTTAGMTAALLALVLAAGALTACTPTPGAEPPTPATTGPTPTPPPDTAVSVRSDGLAPVVAALLDQHGGSAT